MCKSIYNRKSTLYAKKYFSAKRPLIGFLAERAGILAWVSAPAGIVNLLRNKFA